MVNTDQPRRRHAGQLYIYDVFPRDFYEGSTLKLHEWMLLRPNDIESPQDKEKRVVRAVVEVYDRGFHIPGETPDIRVAYDYHADASFFIFRYHSNGKSLLVSSVRLPCEEIAI
jgi:hypothetical protein